MNEKEAWNIIKNVIPSVKAETGYEVDKYFVFSISPSNTPYGSSTGTDVLIVDKSLKKVESVSFDDIKLSNSKQFRIIDVLTL